MYYPGKELENFDKAKVWRKYIYFCTKKYLKGKILEIGPHDELMKNKGLYSNLWSKHQSSFDDLDVN